MVKLPFLNNDKLPKERKLAGTSKYGFSEDDELIESALKELSEAVDAKDHKKMLSALHALIDCIHSKDSNETPE